MLNFILQALSTLNHFFNPLASFGALGLLGYFLILLFTVAGIVGISKRTRAIGRIGEVSTCLLALMFTGTIAFGFLKAVQADVLVRPLPFPPPPFIQTDAFLFGGTLLFLILAMAYFELKGNLKHLLLKKPMDSPITRIVKGLQGNFSSQEIFASALLIAILVNIPLLGKSTFFIPTAISVSMGLLVVSSKKRMAFFEKANKIAYKEETTILVEEACIQTANLPVGMTPCEQSVPSCKKPSRE